jgi:nucleoside-diphosphate-sugar epimerase
LFVNTGSSSEYGRKAFAMRETDILEPDSYYAVAKAAQSLLSRHCSQASGLPIVTLRLFSVYGPYEEPTRLIPKLMMAALGGQPIDMVAPEIARDFIYVDDVVHTYLDIDHLKTLPGEILNIGTGVQSSLQDVVDTVNALCEAPLDVRWGNMESRPWDSDVWVGDISKAKRLMGSPPRTTLREGLSHSLAWYRAHQEMYDGA